MRPLSVCSRKMRFATFAAALVVTVCLVAVGARVLDPTGAAAALPAAIARENWAGNEDVTPALTQTPAPEPDYNHGDELVFFHAVFRHGERTPADTYPLDPYSNSTFSPFGWGQLTNTGRMQMYNTGVFLRERYGHILGPKYAASSTRAQSTASTRARMSASLALAGLWPPAGSPMEWNPTLNWQPVPVDYQPLDEDTLLLARKSCPRYSEALEGVMQSAQAQQMLQDNQEMLDQLSNYTGLTLSTYDDVQSLYSTLVAEEAFGLELPEWTKQFYPDRLIPITAESFVVNGYNSELQKLKGGRLLAEILSEWVLAADGGLPERRATLFAGHDSTVANLALALGVWDTPAQVPGYGITLLLELYRGNEADADEHYVELYLRNSSAVEPFPLTIPGCVHHCPLNKLIRLTQDVIPGDWESDCRPHNPDYVEPPPSGP